MFIMYKNVLLKKTYFSIEGSNNDNWVGWMNSATIFQNQQELIEVIEKYKLWDSKNISILNLQDGKVKSLRESKPLTR